MIDEVMVGVSRERCCWSGTLIACAEVGTSAARSIHREPGLCRVSALSFEDFVEADSAFEDGEEVCAVHEDQRGLRLGVLLDGRLGEPGD